MTRARNNFEKASGEFVFNKPLSSVKSFAKRKDFENYLLFFISNPTSPIECD